MGLETDGKMASRKKTESGGKERASAAAPSEMAPRKRRKEARPGEIVEAGLREFAEKGFAAARLEDIAARAGIVKGTIYRYFENKEALFREAVRLRILPVLQEADEMVEQYPGPTADLLRGLIQAIYARFVASDTKVLLRIIVAEGQRFPDIPAYYHREMITKGEALLRKIIARGVERGEFRETAVSDYPVIIVAPALAAAILQMAFATQNSVDLDRYREAHLDIVLNGLVAR